MSDTETEMKQNIKSADVADKGGTEIMKIKETLKEGESSTVEFKSWKKTANMKERIKLAVDELVAFANSNEVPAKL